MTTTANCKNGKTSCKSNDPPCQCVYMAPFNVQQIKSVAANSYENKPHTVAAASQQDNSVCKVTAIDVAFADQSKSTDTSVTGPANEPCAFVSVAPNGQYVVMATTLNIYVGEMVLNPNNIRELKPPGTKPYGPPTERPSLSLVVPKTFTGDIVCGGFAIRKDKANPKDAYLLFGTKTGSSGQKDNKLRIVGVSKATIGKVFLEIDVEEQLQQCSFSPDGRYVNALTTTGNLIWWDAVSTAKSSWNTVNVKSVFQTLTPPGTEAIIKSFAVSPDNSRVAFAVNVCCKQVTIVTSRGQESVEYQGRVHIWCVETQQVIFTYKFDDPDNERAAYVSYSPDGKWLAANSDKIDVKTSYKFYEWDSFGFFQVVVNTASTSFTDPFTYGDLGVGYATNYVFFDKKGVNPWDFETQPPWQTKVEVKTSLSLIFEFMVSIGVSDPTGNILGIDFGGPKIALVFTLLLEGLVNPPAPKSNEQDPAKSLILEKTGPDLGKIFNKQLENLVISLYLKIAFQFSFQVSIRLKVFTFTVATLYEDDFLKTDLWGWGGQEKGLLLRFQTLLNGLTRVTPWNVRYSGFDEKNYPVYKMPDLSTTDKTSPFYWPTTCAGTEATLPACVKLQDLLIPEKKPKVGEALTSLRWKHIGPDPPKRDKMEVLQITATTQFPDSSDIYTGVCDAEAFKYMYQLTFVDTHRANLDIMISLGPTSGTHLADKSCTITGTYRVRGTWGQGKIVELIRVPNDSLDSDKCWMQPLPQVMQAKTTQAGDHAGIWLSFPAMFCADIHLRYGITSVLEPGNILLNDQTMQSSPPMAQLILHSDGNMAIYGFESDFVIWESGTSVAGTKVVTSSLYVTNGAVVLENTVDGVVNKKILNPNGVAGGNFLAMVECDLQLFADSVILPGRSLWNLTNKPCPTFSRSRSSPRWHRGGSYLYQGETLLPNAGLVNGNGYFQHERGLLHFVRTKTQESLWSMTDESVRNVRTSAFSFLWDGNLVLYDYEGKIVWESKTSGKGATVLRLERCALVLYKTYPNTGSVWSYGVKDCPDTADAAPLVWPAAVSSYPTPMNQMEPGHNLGPGQALLSAYGMLYHQLDGNLVIISRDNTTMSSPVWSSNTAGKCTTSLTFQYDGALILYGCNGEVVWNAGISSATTRPKLIEFLDDCTWNVLDGKIHSHAITTTTLSKTLNSKKCPQNVPVMTLIDHAECWWVQTGFYLSRAQFVATLTFTLALGLQPDGDLVFYATNPTRVLWRSGTSGICASKMDLIDGVPSIFDCQGNVVWQLSNSTSLPSGGEYLTILNDEFVLQDPAFDSIWSSKSIQISTLAPATSFVASEGSVQACATDVPLIVGTVVLGMFLLMVITTGGVYCFFHQKVRSLTASLKAIQEKLEVTEMSHLTSFNHSPSSPHLVHYVTSPGHTEQNPVDKTF